LLRYAARGVMAGGLAATLQRRTGVASKPSIERL
jgi:hypothetical protein